MKKHETVRKPQLSESEIFELGSMIFQQFPRNLDPDKIRTDLGNKGTLGRDLGKFFRDRYAAQPDVDLASWSNFYRRTFGKKVDLSALSVPAKPAFDCWPVVIVPGVVSNNDAFEASKKLFDNAWRYTDDLNTVRDVVERPKTAYVVWVKATVEADSDLANVSADEIARCKLNTLTLFERLVLGLKRFDEVRKHLDVKNVTLCAGSRYADGDVPRVYWIPAYRKLNVGRYDSRHAVPLLRARAAVVPKA